MPEKLPKKKHKRFLGENVLKAAMERIAFTFDEFENVYVSFSGGKDSTVMLHLVMDEAKRRDRRVGVLFIDWEAQYQLTIEHVANIFAQYASHIEPYWVAVPLKTTNACSQFEPEWICWERGKESLWVRDKPFGSVSEADLPFYRYSMTFEEFIVEFGHWNSAGKSTACFVGIRAKESLNRWRTIAGHGIKFNDKPWTNWCKGSVFNIYPIYDWQEEDIWTYHGKTKQPYNRLYDRMYQAGVSLSQMRICEPYGDEQRRGLWLYQLIEPDTWARVAARVSGASGAALYAKEKGNILGNLRITLPNGHSWKSFANHLLDSMPPSTADHYKDKIAVWIRWYQQHWGLGEIPDEYENDTGSADVPSWRRVCKMLLKNDYWCKTLCFSPTKPAAYMKYKRLMERRRSAWGIY